MTFDRAEMAGTVAAFVFHVALIAALSMSLASVARAPEPPAMEVELVEEVGLQSASPEPQAPAPASTAPEIGEAIDPTPAPRIEPPSPAPSVKPVPAKPQTAAPSKPAPRVSRIGDDFLKGIEDSSADDRPARPAARFDAQAQASVARLIADQIRPCALQQRELGPGANRIQVTLNLQLFPSGRLKRSPTLVRVTGDDDENAQYVDLVVNQAIASYRQCSPLRLPAELYQTAQGGWSNINMKYRVP